MSEVENMMISDALNICKHALEPYEGGEEAFIYINKIVNKWVKNKNELAIIPPTDNIYFSVSDPTISTIDNFNNAMVNMEIRRMKNE